MTLLSLSLGSVAPEIILSFVACVVLLADLYLPLALKARVSFLLCVGGLLAAIVACVDGYDRSSEFAMNGLVVDDGIGDVMKTAVCGYSNGGVLLALLQVGLAQFYIEIDR